MGIQRGAKVGQFGRHSMTDCRPYRPTTPDSFLLESIILADTSCVLNNSIIMLGWPSLIESISIQDIGVVGFANSFTP